MAGAGEIDPAKPAPESHTALARKYRPNTFAELIGQDAMVQTLKNAFAQGRIAQAYMLTGVRGVGKTTTARLIARGLNYVGADGEGGPTIDLAQEGEHCRAILEGRHLDVIEMDAASHTGIDDIRDLIDSAHYKPNTARYKVYIIDEVHMLSKAAFNGLLKTLEEPPEHVKFIFATTEVRKVPVTVLSRCQRFDLKRIDIEPLTGHLAKVAAAENAKAAEPALALIAKSAEGSVRDALSILDRALAFATGELTAQDVSGLLGLADRGRIFDLLETVLKGETGAALEQLAGLNRDGAEPAQVIADLAEAVHAVTRIKATGGKIADGAMPEAETERAVALAKTLSIPVLARAWQMLLKGHEEVQNAPRPLAAADMVLVRIAYTADLPTPGDLVGRIEKGEGGAAPNSGKSGSGGQPAAPQRDPAPVASLREEAERRKAPPPQAEEPPPYQPPQEADPGPALPQPKSFEDVISLAEENRDLILKRKLMEEVRLVRFAPGKIVIKPTPTAPKELAQEIKRWLEIWTGSSWAVIVDMEAEGEATLGEKRREARAAEIAEISSHPAIKEVFAHFPDAKIEDIRPLSEETGEPEPETDMDQPFADERRKEDGRSG
ncbi:DNA polymerase III subunit gamma/tau [Methyloligella sp. 2.7D]|uniref:DNA polymerase III subunit gamma/tau n=1 Tax=unclassified Methyloligella TaxID=2625955 RepID=UPI00157D3319|nr:DNA polymerase III subunit gamma/tau [Methyloligella sp. GL2]QKP78569.1 DNA polymerase III subunit gamma/tau [Methyloligella sp. GL2]